MVDQFVSGNNRTMPLRDWKAALTRFTIQFEERMPKT